MSHVHHIELFPAHVQGQLRDIVEAQQLHRFLRVEADFPSWMGDQIDDHGLEVEVDYLLPEPDEGDIADSRSRIERGDVVYLTVDIAKALAMMERTARGVQLRRHLAECERLERMTRFELRPGSQHGMLGSPMWMMDREIEQEAWCEIHADVLGLFYAKCADIRRERDRVRVRNNPQARSAFGDGA